MDQQFYQHLRKIQKKERNNGTLARVDEDFYTKIHHYLDDLKHEAMGDPFSNVHGILKEAQIIATEICERREHKITDAAVVNIHRSYHLFTGKPQFDLVDTTPLNLTPEEEKFYFSLIDTLKNHRGNISLDEMSHSEDIKTETQTSTLTPPKAKEDEVLKRLDEIKKAKPVADEKRKAAAESRPKAIEENPNALGSSDEFYDFDSKRVSKDANLVTLLVYDEVGAIVGVDEKVYGPFRPQDLVTIPNINAKIFVKNRKGRIVKI